MPANIGTAALRWSAAVQNAGTMVREGGSLLDMSHITATKSK